MRLRRLAVLAAPVLLSAAAAHAETVPSLDLRNFHPPTDPKGALYTEETATPARGDWNVGAWFSYAYRSVVLEDQQGNVFSVPLRHQLSLDYLASIGVADRIAIGLAVPSVLWQSGDDDVNTRVATGGGLLPTSALGDPAFSVKAVLLPTSEVGGFGLAALARVTAPVGDRSSYVSDGAVTGELRLLSELKLFGVTDLRVTAGARVRGSERTYVGEQFGHDLPWGVGIVIKPQAYGLDPTGRFLWVAELRGAVALTPEFASGPQSPVLYAFSARYTPGDVSAIAGVEAPITAAVGDPAVRVVLGVGWAPRFYDQDGDGIADDVDDCPELPEDRDGFQDSDGCPDNDDDDDGVPDEDDRCPREKEDADDFQDDDGCPDPDNDGDGILDVNDACPNEPGSASQNPKINGCPMRDSDHDGILDKDDKCMTEPEDRDGFQDADGCPDPDNDHDGVLDEEDACPDKPGPRRSDPKLDGCPSPDKDGDTFDDADDKCPDAPEDFDGDADDDGCPDDDSQKPPAQRAKPLVTIEQQADRWLVKLRIVPTFVVKAGAVELDPKSIPTIRAIAKELNVRPAWVLLVGVQPKGKAAEAEQEALNKSFAIVYALRSFTHRDEVAESVGWSAVDKQPGALATGIGLLVLAPPAPGLPKPAPAAGAPGTKPAAPVPGTKPAPSAPGTKPAAPPTNPPPAPAPIKP